MKYILSLIALFVILTSCEQTLDVELPYVEQLVVRGIIEEGKPITDLSISKTLPPLDFVDVWDFQRHWIDDAEVYLEVNNEIFPCTYRDSSQYQCLGYIPKANDIVKLSAKWKSYEINAETVIPDSTVIVKYDYETYKTSNEEGGESLRIYAYLNPEDGFSYSGAWDYIQSNSDFLIFRYPLMRSFPVNNEGLIRVEFFDESDYLLNFGVFPDWNAFIDNIEAIIFIYDEAVYDYYVNFKSYDDNDFFFSSSGQNLDWNVKGDGFGIFIGKNTIKHKPDITIE